MPPVELVDMAGEPGRLFSPRLRVAVQQAIDAGGQVILFLNRRGFATLVLCGRCKHMLSCPHCSSTLVFHKGRRRAACHLCGHETPLPQRCPECHESALRQVGSGTERVLEDAERAWARRVDRARRFGHDARRADRAGPREFPGGVGAHPGRHADDCEGTSLSRRHARGHHQRRHRAALARLPRKRTHIRLDRAGGRSRGSRRKGRARRRPDVQPGALRRGARRQARLRGVCESGTRRAGTAGPAPGAPVRDPRRFGRERSGGENGHSARRGRRPA